LTKFEILDKNQNFEQKYKFWIKIEILNKNRSFVKNPNFRQKSKF